MKKRSQENIEMGGRLKALRLKRSASVDEVATAIQVAPSTWREWENGRAISGVPYIRMALFFKVGLHELFGISNPRIEIRDDLAKLEEIIQRIYSNL